MAVEDMAQLRSTRKRLRPSGSSARTGAQRAQFVCGEPDAGWIRHQLDCGLRPGHQPDNLSSAPDTRPRCFAVPTPERWSDSRCARPRSGPVDDAVYAESAVHVGPGDVLVMYTDGLVEHDYCSLEAGIVRLQQMIASWPSADLLDCEAIAAEAAPSPRLDDVCLLIARFGPSCSDSENPALASDSNSVSRPDVLRSLT